MHDPGSQQASSCGTRGTPTIRFSRAAPWLPPITRSADPPRGPKKGGGGGNHAGNGAGSQGSFLATGRAGSAAGGQRGRRSVAAGKGPPPRCTAAQQPGDPPRDRHLEVKCRTQAPPHQARRQMAGGDVSPRA